MYTFMCLCLRYILNFSRIVTLILAEKSRRLAFESTLRASFLCRVRTALRNKQAALL